jgi:threonine synthase
MFGTPDFAGRFALSAVNSINWARLMAQIVYYFYAAVRLGAPERPVAFSVPTGNFGDVFAGYAAAKMGLPVARLIVATNVNDIVARALANGDYSAGTVTPTATPSMDIQVSSNFERLLFDLDPAAVPDQMAAFGRERAMRLTGTQLDGAGKLLSGVRVDAEAMALAMRWACEGSGQILDPHTAVGLAAARVAALPAQVPVVTLATAHPGKFRDAVERATGMRPSLPSRVGSLFEREERFDVLPAELGAVTAYISERATPAPSRSG